MTIQYTKEAINLLVNTWESIFSGTNETFPTYKYGRRYEIELLFSENFKVFSSFINEKYQSLHPSLFLEIGYSDKYKHSSFKQINTNENITLLLNTMEKINLKHTTPISQRLIIDLLQACEQHHIIPNRIIGFNTLDCFLEEEIKYLFLFIQKHNIIFDSYHSECIFSDNQTKHKSNSGLALCCNEFFKSFNLAYVYLSEDLSTPLISPISAKRNHFNKSDLKNNNISIVTNPETLFSSLRNCYKKKINRQSLQWASEQILAKYSPMYFFDLYLSRIAEELNCICQAKEITIKAPGESNIIYSGYKAINLDRIKQTHHESFTMFKKIELGNPNDKQILNIIHFEISKKQST